MAHIFPIDFQAGWGLSSCCRRQKGKPASCAGCELCGREPALPAFSTDAHPLQCVCAVSCFIPGFRPHASTERFPVQSRTSGTCAKASCAPAVQLPLPPQTAYLPRTVDKFQSFECTNRQISFSYERYTVLLKRFSFPGYLFDFLSFRTE